MRNPTLARIAFAASLALLVSASAVRVARAQISVPQGFRDTLVAGGLAMPVGFTFVPDAPGGRVRTIVLEQKLRNLRVVANPPVAGSTLAGMVPDIEWIAGERGLLGVAVDPRWPASPFVYVHYTAITGKIQLARFRMSGDLANTAGGGLTMDVASRLLLIDDIPDSSTNHNGGTLRFGPDGMLWYSLGEDLGSCYAQDTTSLLGKLLRLDVTRLPGTGAGPVPRALLTPADNPHASSPDSNFRLVHSIGLRNPFRFHVDRVTGAVFVADVGHVTWEEIDRITQPANLGWPWREGPSPLWSCPAPAPAGLTEPIATIRHPEGLSIISLDVYRTPAGATQAFPAEYEGDYFFGDYFSGIVRRIGFDGTSWVPKPAIGQPTPTEWANGAESICDANVGPDGAWWYLRQSIDGTYFNGVLRRVEWVGPPPDTTLDVPGVGRPAVRFGAPRPNPARGEVHLAYVLPETAPVELTLFDASGRSVRRLESGPRAAGAHVSMWDGRDDAGHALPPGLYLANLRVFGVPHVQRVVLAR